MFDALAAEVLSTPDFKTKVYQGKMALVPLAISPDRLALMFYCLEADKDDVLPVLQEIARSHRASLLKSGEMAPRDGFLTEWAFKSDAQTTQEMKDGIHDAQLSLIMELFPVENLTPQRKPPKI